MVMDYSQRFRFTLLLRRSVGLRCLVACLWLAGWALSAEGLGPTMGGWLAGLDGDHHRHLTVDVAGRAQLVLSHSRELCGDEPADLSWTAADDGAAGEDHFILLDGADSSTRRRGRLWGERGAQEVAFSPMERFGGVLAGVQCVLGRRGVTVVSHAAAIVRRSRTVMLC